MMHVAKNKYERKEASTMTKLRKLKAIENQISKCIVSRIIKA